MRKVKNGYAKIKGMESPENPPSFARRLGWNRTSYVLMSGFVLLLGVIAYVWWPLVTEYLATYNPAYPWWMQVDWLLLGIFAAMSLLLMAGADVRLDLPIVVVGLVGGLVIEAWGTQTLLWTYYTNERPPLWIIPAWPIASLAIDRLYRGLARRAGGIPQALDRRAVLGRFWNLCRADGGLRLAHPAPFTDLDGGWAVRVYHLHTGGPASHAAAIHRGQRPGVLFGVLGHYPRMLDVLYVADAAFVCGAGARHGGSGFLARGAGFALCA